MRNRALLIFLLLNVLDVLTTWVDLQHGAHEGNPLIASLLVQIGFGGLILFKVGLFLTITVGVLTLERLKAFRTARFILLVGILLGVLWVSFNLLGLLLR